MKNSKIGRNDPCPCGSGKKYKKCCLNKDQIINSVKTEPDLKRDEIDLLMEEGWLALNKDQVTEACNIWLEVWEKLKVKFKSEVKDIRDIDTGDIYTGSEFISNWIQDLELELGNAGRIDSVFYEKRRVFCSEFCSLFPESDDNIIHNMKRAIGESYYAIGNIEEGEKYFINLIKDYPRSLSENRNLTKENLILAIFLHNFR